MIAVDTNVLVRLLVGDDPKQSAAARSIFKTGPVWIAKTVLLETAWVLRSVYQLKEHAILDAFARVLGLRNVEVEDEAAVAAALQLANHGIDFADALHLSSRPPQSEFVSFDGAFVRRARAAGASKVAETRA